LNGSVKEPNMFHNYETEKIPALIKTNALPLHQTANRQLLR